MASPTEGTFIIILKGRVRGIATQKINYMGQRCPTGRDETVRKRAASCTPLQVNLEDAGGRGGEGERNACHQPSHLSEGKQRSDFLHGCKTLLKSLYGFYYNEV